MMIMPITMMIKMLNMMEDRLAIAIFKLNANSKHWGDYQEFTCQVAQPDTLYSHNISIYGPMKGNI